MHLKVIIFFNYHKYKIILVIYLLIVSKCICIGIDEYLSIGIGENFDIDAALVLHALAIIPSAYVDNIEIFAKTTKVEVMLCIEGWCLCVKVTTWITSKQKILGTFRLLLGQALHSYVQELFLKRLLASFSVSYSF